MEIITITMISIFLVSWVISRFEPFTMILEVLPDKLLYNLFRLLLTCIKCLMFWITLIYTENIVLASGMAFIGFWYDKFIGPIERKVRL
jgi:hypothetical protein